MYRSIVVPLDGSTFGEHALPIALGVARRAAAQLHLVHVHVAGEPAGAPVAMRHDARDAERRIDELAYLDQLARRLRAIWGGPITSTLLEPPVVETLCDYATSIGADLIVMSTHARGTLMRLWLGCVADKLVRHAPMPVLLVRPPERPLDLMSEPTIKQILVTLDGSTLSEQILARALELGALTEAEYTLLQVVEPPPIESVGLEELGAEQLQERALRYLEGVAGHLRAEGLRVRADAVVGDSPAAAILEYARAHPADLIAMETHGRGGLGRVLLGSVADHVVRSVAAPVLLHCPHVEE